MPIYEDSGLLIYGECPFCGSMDTRSVRTAVVPDSDPSSAWDERHCDACGHDYTDHWELVGNDQCEVFE